MNERNLNDTEINTKYSSYKFNKILNINEES